MSFLQLEQVHDRPQGFLVFKIWGLLGLCSCKGAIEVLEGFYVINTTRNPEPQTPNPKPDILNPRPLYPEPTIP